MLVQTTDSDNEAGSLLKGGFSDEAKIFLAGVIRCSSALFNEKVMKGMILLHRDSRLLGRKRGFPMDPTCEHGITGRALNKRFDA